VSFAAQDLVAGALYYDELLPLGGVAGRLSGVYGYDFGQPAAGIQSVLVPGASDSVCVGCHAVSRDGTRMTYGRDDADMDDEYGDLQTHLFDTIQRATIPAALSPGFRTFTHDGTRLLASDGKGALSPPAFTLWNGTTGASLGTTVPLARRGTQPEWSADDGLVVFVEPKTFFSPTGSSSIGDDEHFGGGSLYTMTYDPTVGNFGMPSVLITSAGENNYAPAFSPDSPPSFVIFNRVQGVSGLAQDAFYNPNARVLLVPVAGGTPVEAARLEGASTSTNSWPRFAPTITTYKGHMLAWVTFTSTRDYGLRVRNSIPTGQVNCYPPESPENPNGSHTQMPANCVQPQIWMAAIDLTVLAQGTDPSFTAFWFPFQDQTAHTHQGQWSTGIVAPASCNDAGIDGGTSCIADGQPCGGAVCGTCCEVCSAGVCGAP
jgi:hypothetical protein